MLFRSVSQSRYRGRSILNAVFQKGGDPAAPSDTTKIIEEIKNIPIEGQRLKEAVFLVARQADYYNQLLYTEKEKQEMLKATVQKLFAETDLIRFDVQAAQQLDNLGREVKQLEPIVNIIKALVGRR